MQVPIPADYPLQFITSRWEHGAEHGCQADRASIEVSEDKRR